MTNVRTGRPTPPPPLHTDLYQLTMAYGYWKQKMADKESVFHLYFRRAPFGQSFALNCGLDLAIDFLQNFTFSEEHVSFLGNLRGIDKKPLFDEHFLNYLQRLRLSLDIEAIPEGEIVFPNQPLIRVRGSLLQAQLVETALLNIINFSTLIATKATRVVKAAAGDDVLEFGLRRAQGVDGALAASRAAFIGGCHATSNVWAGQAYQIPVRGTHAHAWVMAFDDEQTAFDAYAQHMPNNTTLLVDTFNTAEGIKKAIKTGKKLREKGFDLNGIRLDSGDLAKLSIEARKMLDEAGFQNTNIVASNDLDEYEIEKLKKKGAKINVWGVGTKLVTAYDQPALGGVYKLAAIKNEQNEWDFKMKHSEDFIKMSTPGILNVRRRKGENDILFDETLPNQLPDGRDLLVPIFQKGKLVYQSPDVPAIRAFATKNVADFEQQNFDVEMDNLLLEKKKAFASKK
ncbi:MAG: hypothetical protein RL757_1542 [Bacteroidota bacterium]|jgi:nicotinate phosphoribosyltransferase